MFDMKPSSIKVQGPARHTNGLEVLIARQTSMKGIFRLGSVWNENIYVDIPNLTEVIIKLLQSFNFSISGKSFTVTVIIIISSGSWSAPPQLVLNALQLSGKCLSLPPLHQQHYTARFE
jgi:hypothetical protein